MEPVISIPGTAEPDVTIVGDVILDRYWHASVTRCNPEAPGVVCEVSSVTSSLGGCGAVATICAGLDMHCSLAAAIGKDRDGDEVVGLLNGVVDGGSLIWLSQPQTTVKQRVIANQQLMHTRFDFEEVQRLDKSLVRHVDQLPMGKVVLISDYGKGFCSRSLIRRVIRRARRSRVPVLVDPARNRNVMDYHGATLIKMNASEAAEMIDADCANAAAFLSSHLNCAVIVTDGGDGMYFHQGDQHCHQEAVPTRIVDVTGAGDTVLSALAVGLVRGYGWRQTLALAAELASKQVAQHGVQQVKEADNARRV